jgi:hypothetical protein
MRDGHLDGNKDSEWTFRQAKILLALTSICHCERVFA